MNDEETTEKAITVEPGASEVTLMGFFERNAQDIGVGVASVIIVIAIVEVLKPWLRYLLMEKLKMPEKLEASAIRSFSFLICALPVWALGFRESWAHMNQSDLLLDWPSTFMVGCSITWTGTQIAWLLIHDVKPVRMMRVWLYKRFSVTEDEVSPPEVPRENNES
jgi:hypothetical protein